jgi:hypothetical protein
MIPLKKKMEVLHVLKVLLLDRGVYFVKKIMAQLVK